MDDEVFTLSEMTVDVHKQANSTVIGFNGTVEWALDSVEANDAVWLRGETQLRERLGATFRRLTREPTSWRVDLEVAGRDDHIEHGDAAEAYGLALLRLITRRVRTMDCGYRPGRRRQAAGSRLAFPS